MFDFIKAILHPTYWITHQHPVPEAWQLGLSIFFGTLLAIGLVAGILGFLKKFAKPIRNIFTRVSIWGWTMGLLGFMFLFFSVERVAFVSARMFYLIWIGIAIWWIYYIIKYSINDAPRLVAERKEYLDKQKYLPKKKKK
jgi:hypothetical protein